MESKRCMITASIETRELLRRISEIKYWTQKVAVERAIDMLIKNDPELKELTTPTVRR